MARRQMECDLLEAESPLYVEVKPTIKFGGALRSLWLIWLAKVGDEVHGSGR